MATVLAAAQAAQAARTVALAAVAAALEADPTRVDDAKQAYEGGLAAELGKWPSWISFAETVGVKAEHLNHSSDETPAFRRVLDVIMDQVIRPAWSSQKIKNLGEEAKSLTAQGKTVEARDVERQVQSARTRRTELANVVKYGAIVGRYVLDRMTQERELANVHKATVWAGVFAQCNRHCTAAREAGAVITRDDLISVAAGVLDGQQKPERTDGEKLAKIISDFWKAYEKLQGAHVLADSEIRAINNALNKNAQVQKEATAVEASIQPVTRKSDPAPKPVAASAPKTGKAKATPKSEGKPAATPKSDKPAPVAPKSSGEAAKIAADVI